MTDGIHAKAGEYVLGTLDAAEREAFARRLESDAAARAAVTAWRDRLVPLLAGGAEVPPPAHLWPAIEARIAPRPANDNRVSPIWRGWAIAASVLAVAGGTLALRPPPPPPMVLSPAPPIAPSYVAAVTTAGTEPALLVTIDPVTRKAMVRAIALTPPARKSLELWYIGAGRDPQSMGLIAGDAQREMALGHMMKPGEKLGASLFAITAEPMGGAPGGRPTGAILYSGKPMPVSGT